MIVTFRERDYVAEARAHSLPRVPADVHPLSPTSSFSLQVGVIDEDKNVTLDPLRAPHQTIIVSSRDSENASNVSGSVITESNFGEHVVKEWTTFKRFLVQKFPPPKTVAISSVADLATRGHKVDEKSSNLHPDDLDDPLNPDEDVKYITQQEYVARLSEMRNEICCAWGAHDYFYSLKSSVKVARLLRDTTLLQFYPTLFTLVTEILDMLGDMVWDRIKRKAEFLEDGTQIVALPEDFQASDICFDAKETCQNWFCKISSIRDLLPRIFLELAILPCWRFLLDDSADVIERLLAMMRGLGSPLASAYCHLYLVYCVQKLPTCDNGYLITCIRDFNLMMLPIISSKEDTSDRDSVNKQLLVHLMEPPVEYTMKCIFKDRKQEHNVLVKLGQATNLSEVFGKCSCVSLILHHLLKELPSEVIMSNALHIFDLIESSIGFSVDKCMNFRLLGFRLYETDPPMEMVNAILERVIQDASQYQELNSYLKVMEGYVDIVLQNQMINQLEVLLEGIAERACNKWINDDELESLQSIFIKILSHTKRLEDVLELNFFFEIIDVMRGAAKNVINMRILEMATRNTSIRSPTIIQFLFEVAPGLHNGQDFSNLDSDIQPLHRLLARFVHMVDFGTDWERHLTFLIECRASFASADVMKETLICHSNCLVMNASKNGKQHDSFGRSCLAFSETTIPSISAPVIQLFLYLETAEVALRSWLLGHADGLIDSALSSLQSLVIEDLRTPMNVDRIISIIQKLCSLLIMVPGNPIRGITYIPRSLLSLVNSQSWRAITRFRVRTLCAIISLMAALSQHNLPYYISGVNEVPGNGLLYFDDPSYHEELASLCGLIIQDLVPAIQQEASPVTRGSLALEACNCIASFLKMNDKISSTCNELMEIAGSCLSTRHSYILSTSVFLAKQFQTNSISNI